jgi:hypothetical protein
LPQTVHLLESLRIDGDGDLAAAHGPK